MSTVFASFVALCLADGPPAIYDDVVLVWGGADCAQQADVKPGVVGRRAPQLRRATVAQPTVIRPRMALPRMARVVSDDQVQATPKAWIGVRLAPIPEALAAHLDKSGLMVANVAKDSPADDAGLERYDVIVAFNGERTETGESLVAAIASSGADKQAKISVIKNGSERELKITPGSVPDVTGLEYKYDDPTPPVVDDKTSIHGHTLKISPDGQLQLEDLGQLDNLPDIMKQYWKFAPDGKLNIQPFPPGQIPFDWKLDLGNIDLGDINLGDMGGDANVQLQIQTSDDGETLMVRRDADGKITVERTDADGKTTSTEYEDADALEKGDAEAHKLYSHHAGGMRWLRVQPPSGNLPGLQKDFREQIERQMKDIREQAEQTRKNAQQWRRSNQPQRGGAQQQPGAPRQRTRVESRSRNDDGGSSMSEALSVVVDEDGAITVKVSRNGNKAEYSFKNEADFKAREPELFERYKKMAE